MAQTNKQQREADRQAKREAEYALLCIEAREIHLRKKRLSNPTPRKGRRVTKYVMPTVVRLCARQRAKNHKTK